MAAMAMFESDSEEEEEARARETMQKAAGIAMRKRVLAVYIFALFHLARPRPAGKEDQVSDEHFSFD